MMLVFAMLAFFGAIFRLFVDAARVYCASYFASYCCFADADVIHMVTGVVMRTLRVDYDSAMPVYV